MLCCEGVLTMAATCRVRENAASARTNVMGALAAVPAAGWEQRAELEQKTSKLAQVGGLEGLRVRANPLTQVLASVQDYIAKIDQDISSDSGALAHDKAPAALPQMTFSKEEGMQVVPPPAPIPAITAATSAEDRQRILDETARLGEQRAMSKLQNSKAPKAGDKWKAASSSVADDLSAAADAINSLQSFTQGLPDTPEGYQQKDSAANAGDEALNESESDNDALKEEQQHALMQQVHDGSRTQLTEAERRDADALREKVVGNPFDPLGVARDAQASGDEMLDTRKHVEFAQALRNDHEQQHEVLKMAKRREQAAVLGLHQQEAQTRAVVRQREADQRAQDREHEQYLAHELAEDKKAEDIALKRKEMHNEIERVEARMQIEASKQWEAVQAARKRASTKESDKLAHEKWIKDKEEERAKEALWQQVQHDDKYMAPGHLRADGSRLSAETDIRNKWGRAQIL